MALSEMQLSSITTAVEGLVGSGTPLVPELRRRFPELTFVRCAQGDMEGQPYHCGDGYQLYLLNRSNFCISLTSHAEQADGVVVAL